MDGQCPTFFDELLRGYEIIVRGGVVEPIKEDAYKDYIDYIQEKKDVREEGFWKEYLKDLHSATLLPFTNIDNKRNKTVNEVVVSDLLLSEESTNRLKKYAQTNRLTINTILQGVWAYLLHKYNNASNISFGVTVSGRPPELENSDKRIGLYINTLPLLSKLDSNESILDWLSNIQAEHTECRDHQYTSLSTIQRLSGVTKDLFDSILVFENYPIAEVLKENKQILEIDHYESIDSSNYLMTLIASMDDKLKVLFSYDASLLNEIEVENIKRHFAYVLEQIVNGLANKTSELELLSPSDRSQILDGFNATALEYGYGSSIVDCFSAVAADYGDRVAIRDGAVALTYTELDVLSNQLAHYLLSNHQIGLDDLVGVKLERGSWLLVSLLGILKSGGAYVPIDSGYPADRIAHIESDSGCKITIDPSFIASFRDAVSDLPADLPTVVINPDTLSYVMYTSGSTGMPKGVMITHDNVVSLSKSCDYIPLDTDTVWLSTGSVSFDATTIEFWGTLLNGGCLILSDMDSLLDSSSLGHLIDTHKVTTLWMTASWFHQVVEEDLSIFSGLSYLLVGGDKVLYKYTNRIKEAYPDLKLLNGYGPTENTTFSTTHTILGDQDQDLPIGKPIKNSTAYILGDSLEVLPAGVVGELCLGGSGLARGYLNREELTNEKFIAHPFKEGERLYKTGDLARWLPDGSIAFVGRKDDQVKIRGYRIELGEIESVLHDVSGVVQGVVQVTTDAQGVKRLVGYVVVEADLDREGIISGLSERLPDYMIPQLWVLLDSLPLNRNGKVDKKSLPSVDVSELQGVEYVAPQTATEEKLSQYWSELLGVERVGIEDDFFVLGGHSLLATRVATYIRGEFEVDIRIRDLFSYTRLVDLCSYIDSLEKSSVVSIGSVERPERIPLSFAQERLWFIDQLEQGSSSYHMPGVFEISGAIDIEILQSSINAIINRHEVLRTVYKQEDGVAYQEVLPEDQWALEQNIKIDGLSKEAIDTLIDKEIARPFDLSSDHMLRVTLLEEEGKAKLLIFNMHHIASDGWSHPILLEELLGYYRSELKGEALALADLPIQYADYSIWQREYLSGDCLATQLDYWKDTLSGVSPLELPLDYVRPKEQSMAGDSLSFDLSSDILEGLKAISKDKGSTLFMTLLSAFKVLMYRYSGQDDICIGTPIANREQEEVSGLIGFFVNTLALRSDLSGNPSFEGLLSQVKDTTLSAYEHQQVPLRR